MVKDALDAFVQRDSAAARAIIPRDQEVDALNREMHAALTQHMMEHPDTISRCLHWIVAAKSLERIADHAKNIAEEVVYLCEAQDIRHLLAKIGRPFVVRALARPARPPVNAARRLQGCAHLLPADLEQSFNVKRLAQHRQFRGFQSFVEFHAAGVAGDEQESRNEAWPIGLDPVQQRQSRPASASARRK